MCNLLSFVSLVLSLGLIFPLASPASEGKIEVFATGLYNPKDLEFDSQGNVSVNREILFRFVTEYLARWKAKGWQTSDKKSVANRDLWEALDAAMQRHQLEWRWVKGHAGVLENERCDQLAMTALRQPNLPVDDGYENKLETDGVRPDMQEGEPCRKCSTPVIKRVPRKKPKHKS